MANVVYDIVSVTTASGGGVTGYSSTLNGKLLSIAYVKTDFEDTVDFTITTEKTLQDVWDEDNVTDSETLAPRQPTHTTAGVAITYDGTRAVNDYIGIAHERIKIVIANGGDTKSGSFTIVIEGSK